MIRREPGEWSVVGHDVHRLDGPPKVRGEMRYLADMEFPGSLHCVLARSVHPHAKLLSVETEAARAVPGVVAVLTGQDVLAMEGVQARFGPAFRDQPLLALEKVCYVGEPVAAVAAESREAAEAAAALVEAEYEELPYVEDPLDAAQPGAPLIHELLEPAGAFADLAALKGLPGTNVCTHYKLRHGDADRALAEAEKVFEDTFFCPPVSHAHLEPHGTVAWFEPSGRLIVHTTSQSPSFVRQEMAVMFGLSISDVRVIVPPLGGSYGGKIYCKLEPVVCLMAKVTGRPVRCHLTREEVFLTTSRHGAVTKIWTGVKEGRITARRVEVYYDTGAYAEIGPRIAQKTGSTAPGPYQFPNVRVDSFCVYTNKTPSGPLRGFGVPQLAIAYETHMDMAAAYLGRDPVDLRREYALEEGDLYATGSPMTSIGIKPALEAVAEGLGWPAEGAVPPRAEREGHIARGRGVALGIKAVLSPSVSNATVELTSDGSALIRCSTVEMGQGATTIYAQLAAEELGLSFEKVRVILPDTDQTPYDTLSAGSRSTYHMGNAVVLAARDVRGKLFETAAEMLEVPAGDLDIREERVFARSFPGRGVTIREVFLRRFGAPGTTLSGEGSFTSQVDKADPETGQTPRMTEHWFAGATGAEVEVDTETGLVRVKKLVCAADVGRAINPRHCGEQIRGAAILTNGFTLFEAMRFEEGRLTNGTFLEYPLPGFRDLPAELVSCVVEHPVETGPYGARGVGETGTLSLKPAILNALFDALGVWFREVPVTPERILRALREGADMAGEAAAGSR